MASSVRRAAQRLGAGAASAARTLAAAGQPTPATHPELLAPGELQPGVTAAEFAGRRAALAAMLPPGAVAVLPAAPLVYMAGGMLSLCCRGSLRHANHPLAVAVLLLRSTTHRCPPASPLPVLTHLCACAHPPACVQVLSRTRTASPPTFCT